MLGLLGPRFFRLTFGSLFLGLSFAPPIEVMLGPDGPLRVFGSAFLTAALASGLLTVPMVGPLRVSVGLNPSDPGALVADLDLVAVVDLIALGLVLNLS